MKTVFSIGFFILYIHHLTAQVPETFLVDSMNLYAKQTLPFDRPFILGFRGASTKSIYSAFLFEWVIRGDTIRTLKQKTDKNGVTSLDFLKIKPDNVFKVENGSDVYVHAQPPSKNFAIMLAHRFDGDLLDEALKAGWYLYTNNPDSANVMNGLSDKVEQKIVQIPGIPLSELDISTFANDWLLPLKDSVATPDSINKYIRKGFTRFYVTTLDSSYNKLDLVTSSPVNLTSSNVSTIVRAASIAEISTLEFSPLVSILSRTMMNGIFEGTVAFQKDLLSSRVKIHDLPARLKNLNASITEIEKLRQYSELIQAQLHISELAQLISDLGAIKDSIETNRNLLKTVSAEVLKAIAEDDNLKYSTWAFAHNEVWDLKTRGSYQVIPEIGIASIFAIGNEKSEMIIRPYLGASIYFRPVDKNVPFKYFDKKYRFLHRFSASVGITVGKVEQGEFSDFVNNMNLLIGGNYKITREFSISTGLALLMRSNANHAIDDKTTSLNPYLGISFDIDFMQSIQKVTGKFSL